MQIIIITISRIIQKILIYFLISGNKHIDNNIYKFNINIYIVNSRAIIYKKYNKIFKLNNILHYYL